MVTHLFIKYNDYLLKIGTQISLVQIHKSLCFKLRQKYDLETVLKTKNNLNFNLYLF
jgi:hypothetical protein